MIPILYEYNETAFETMGIGALADTISARVRRVLNGKDELELAYPVDGIRFADIQNDRIIMAQPEYKKDAQPYRIYKITKPLKGSVKVYARHVSEQKNFIPVMPFTAGTLTETFTRLPNYTAEACPFTFWSDKSVTAAFKMKTPASLGAVLGGTEGSILDIYGGEYEFDKYTVKLWSRRGADNGVVVRYGKNLTKLEQSESLDQTITGVCPYWMSTEEDVPVVTIPGDVVESQYADLYAYRRTVTRDFSDIFQDGAPTEAQLRAAAEAYVSGTGVGVPKVSLDVSFEHLAQYEGYSNLENLEIVNLGDTVHVEYEKANVSVSARIVETDYDVLREKYNSVKVGRVKASLTQTIRELSESVEKVQKNQVAGISQAISDAVQAASDKITGVQGGHIRVNYDADGEPYELLILDTDNIATATNVIRINMNGIGFSTTGYSGTYRTAWTIDGHFTADFIDTGTLTANLIRSGLLTDIANRNYWNLDTGVFVLGDYKKDATSKQQFYLSTSSSSTTGGEWQDTMPTWSEGKYVWTRIATTVTNGDDTTSTNYSTPVYDSTLTTSISAADAARAAVNNANLEEQLIYKSAASGTTSMAGTTTWITSVTGAQNTWTLKRPQYSSDYPVLFVATQRKSVGGTVTCTTPQMDETTTVIDGGHITTGSIDASRVSVTNLNASNITSGTLSADRIGANTLAIGNFTAAAQQSIASTATSKNQYYLSTSSTSATGGSWSDSTPTWVSGKYVWVRVATTTTRADGTTDTKYSTAVYDRTLTDALTTASSASSAASTAQTTANNAASAASTAQTTANNAASAASSAQTTANGANAQEQLIYKSQSGGSAPSATTTWITDATGGQNTWTIKRPQYSTSYPALYIATQRKTVGGTVTCTTPLLDETTTVIDGGNIITGTVNANKITANSTFTQKLYATDLNITGGSVNISTSSNTTDIIQLNASVGSNPTINHFASIRPGRLMASAEWTVNGSNYNPWSKVDHYGIWTYSGSPTPYSHLDSTSLYFETSTESHSFPPNKISASKTFTPSTSYAYSGISVAIPAGKYYMFRAGAWCNESTSTYPTGVVLSTSSTSLSAWNTEIENAAGTAGYQKYVSYSGFASTAKTYYLWVKANNASVTIGANVDGFYF